MTARAHVQVEVRGRVGRITLSRPERHNAFDERTILERAIQATARLNTGPHSSPSPTAEGKVQEGPGEPPNGRTAERPNALEGGS